MPESHAETMNKQKLITVPKYVRLARRLALTTQDISSWIPDGQMDACEPPEIVLYPAPALVIEHSEAVDIGKANAALYDIVVIKTNTSNGLTVDLLGSNDLENWVTLSETIGASAPGYYTSTFKIDIAFQFLRLRYKMWQYYPDFGEGSDYCTPTPLSVRDAAGLGGGEAISHIRGRLLRRASPSSQ